MRFYRWLIDWPPNPWPSMYLHERMLLCGAVGYLVGCVAVVVLIWLDA